jgi:hypothetical protein
MMMKGNEMTALPVSPVEALKLVATLTFRPFTDSDWNAWAGCESESPMICETDNFTVIIDGEVIVFNSYHENNDTHEWTNFTLRFDEAY